MKPKELKPASQMRTMLRRINLVVFIIFLIPIIATIFCYSIVSLPALFFLPALIVWLALLIIIDAYIVAMCRHLSYSLDTDAVLLNKGVFWKRRTTVPYKMITNIDITQGPVQRSFGLSNIHIQTAGLSGGENTHAEIVMRGIKEPEELKAEIMACIRKPVSATAAVDAEIPESANVLNSILEELKAIRQSVEK